MPLKHLALASLPTLFAAALLAQTTTDAPKKQGANKQATEIRVDGKKTDPKEQGKKEAGKKEEAKAPLTDDQYKLGPDSMEHDGVPQGVVKEFEMADSKTFPGFQRKWWVYIPAQYDGKTPAALMVFQDGGGYINRKGSWRVPVVFDNLIHKKEMPVTIGVFINPGDKPLKPGEPPRKRADGRPASPSNRSVEYDTLSDKYATFLLDEILPEVRKHALISNDPEKRAICGSSSGGICAFTVAWERPDQFRKVLSTIGSFTNIRGGGAYPEIVKKADKKPIRVFQQDGTNDIVNQFGSWPEGNKAMAAALVEKGYDHRIVWGEGTHNAKHGASILPDALRWLWRETP